MSIRSKHPSSRENPRRHAIEDLRRTIDCLPLATREAMLDGVLSERIIVGAYVDRQGGVCPMMAAHRRGGRTDFLAFAKSWDRFTGAGRRSRRASERELGVLVAHLQASLDEDAGLDLRKAIEEHKRLRARRAARPRTSDYVREAEPRGLVILRRLRPGRRRYNAVSEGRTNMISGTTHAGEVLSR
jgi:hypothetical protein